MILLKMLGALKRHPKYNKTSQNIELPAAVKTIRKVVMLPPVVALASSDAQPKKKIMMKGKEANRTLIELNAS